MGIWVVKRRQSMHASELHRNLCNVPFHSMVCEPVQRAHGLVVDDGMASVKRPVAQ